jgi:hypothetical protein
VALPLKAVRAGEDRRDEGALERADQSTILFSAGLEQSRSHRVELINRRAENVEG